MAQRAPRVQLEVVAERLGEPLHPAERHAKAAVGRRRQKQSSSRREHAPHLGQPALGVSDVLDHLARPHHFERAVPQRERFVDRREPEVELGMTEAGAGQRRLGDVDPDRAGAGRDDLGGEVTHPATEVEHAVSRADPLEQERAA